MARSLLAAGEEAEITVFTVFWYTLFMALASGLGAVPFFFVDAMKANWKGTANAMACGVMLAASFDLVHEGQQSGEASVICGVFMGALFVKVSQEILAKYDNVSITDLKGSDARKAVLMVAIMTIHAFGEGSGVGVSFSGQRGRTKGTLVTLAIGIHNIPEGLAVAMVLASRGASAKSALFWSIVSSIGQPLVAVPAFMFVQSFTLLLPFGLGFAAGSMIWMVFAELIPESLEEASARTVANAATGSAALLEGFRMTMERMSEMGASDPIVFLGLESTIMNLACGVLGFLLVELLRILSHGGRAGMACMFGCCAGALLAYGSANMYSLLLTPENSQIATRLLMWCGCSIVASYLVVALLRRVFPATWASGNSPYGMADILPKYSSKLASSQTTSKSLAGLSCALFVLVVESMRKGASCGVSGGASLIPQALRSFPKAIFAASASRIVLLTSMWQSVALAAAMASVEELTCACQVGTWLAPPVALGVPHVAALSGCMIGLALLCILPQVCAFCFMVALRGFWTSK